MKTGIDPRVDYAFKKVFGSEANVPLLSDLLHAVLKPERRIVDLQLLNPFNEKNWEEDKLSVLDIKARDELGQQYNVEMQLFGFPFCCKRYYTIGRFCTPISFAKVRTTRTCGRRFRLPSSTAYYSRRR